MLVSIGYIRTCITCTYVGQKPPRLEPPIRKRVLKDERKDLSSLGFQHVLDDFANPDDDAHHRRRDHHNNQTTINVSAE
eukprot:1326095-Amorphochlora_amoeboformis.AAC.1